GRPAAPAPVAARPDPAAATAARHPSPRQQGRPAPPAAPARPARGPWLWVRQTLGARPRIADSARQSAELFRSRVLPLLVGRRRVGAQSRQNSRGTGATTINDLLHASRTGHGSDARTRHQQG